jgi:hypothetical protein
MAVILATQEAEIRRITVESQPRQIVRGPLPQKKKKKSLKWSGGVAQGVGPELKPQGRQKRKKSYESTDTLQNSCDHYQK